MGHSPETMMVYFQKPEKLAAIRGRLALKFHCMFVIDFAAVEEVRA
jgi:hypothetical protein